MLKTVSYFRCLIFLVICFIIIIIIMLFNVSNNGINRVEFEIIN